MSNCNRNSDWEAAFNSNLAETEWQVRAYNEVTSTMDVAKELAAELSLDETGLVITKHQSDGRGRQTRSWSAASGALYATYVFPTSHDKTNPSAFTLIAGYSICKILQSYSCPVGIKWPNDILTLDGYKVCGILAESLTIGCLQFVLLGVGINLIEQPTALLNSTSVKAISGKEIKPPELATQIGVQLKKDWAQFNTHGFAPFKSHWESEALYIGKQVELINNGTSQNGVLRGVDGDGSLLLEVDGEVSTVTTGDLSSLKK